MSPESFISWLEGFLEGCGKNLNEEQVNKINQKMKKVASPLIIKEITVKKYKDILEPYRQPYEPYVPYVRPYVPSTGDHWPLPYTYCDTNGQSISDNKIFIED